jgi:hypothetical protein
VSGPVSIDAKSQLSISGGVQQISPIAFMSYVQFAGQISIANRTASTTPALVILSPGLLTSSSSLVVGSNAIVQLGSGPNGGLQAPLQVGGAVSLGAAAQFQVATSYSGGVQVLSSWNLSTAATAQLQLLNTITFDEGANCNFTVPVTVQFGTVTFTSSATFQAGLKSSSGALPTLYFGASTSISTLQVLYGINLYMLGYSQTPAPSVLVPLTITNLSTTSASSITIYGYASSQRVCVCTWVTLPRGVVCIMC